MLRDEGSVLSGEGKVLGSRINLQSVSQDRLRQCRLQSVLH
uniref:Uncharacterized protein n=1 Tax=Anguilla anguilla TaxID=7936 RepID=A0A0E9VK95_ANGAN